MKCFLITSSIVFIWLEIVNSDHQVEMKYHFSMMLLAAFVGGIVAVGFGVLQAVFSPKK